MGEALVRDSGPGILDHLFWFRTWVHEDESVPGFEAFTGLTLYLVITALMEHEKNTVLALELGLERKSHRRPSRVSQLESPVHQKFAGSVPSRGTYLDCGLNP